MRFEQLEYIIAVAETESFSAAAQKLFVTQQAISIAMKQLEEELGKPLFIKESNKTLLNDYGESVLEFAKKTIQDKAVLLHYFMGNSAEQPIICVNIASTSCVANITLPEIIALYQKKKQKLMLQIAQKETMIQVLNEVQAGEKDIGLISMNEVEFVRKFAYYTDSLQMDILARDEIIGVINRKEYDGACQEIIQEQFNDSLKTLYNIEPADDYRIEAKANSIVCSSDADFHRAILEKKGAMVTMSGLSYQYFFNSRKYVALPLQNIDETILHVAVYRKDSSETIKEMVCMIRKEMHIK